MTIPRPEDILGDTGVALVYSHIYLLLIGRFFGHKFLETSYLINAPVSSCSFGLYEEVFLYILTQRNPIVK